MVSCILSSVYCQRPIIISLLSAVYCHLSIVSCIFSSVHSQLSIVICLQSAVYCHLSTVSCLLSSVYCQLFIVIFLLPTVYCHLSTVRCLLLSFYGQLSLARCLLSAIYDQPLLIPPPLSNTVSSHTNRPLIAGAVPQTPLSFIDSFSQSSFVEISSEHQHSYTVRARDSDQQIVFFPRD